MAISENKISKVGCWLTYGDHSDSCPKNPDLCKKKTCKFNVSYEDNIKGGIVVKKEKNCRVILSLPEPTKDKLTKHAKSLGLALSQYIKMKMMEEVNK